MIISAILFFAGLATLITLFGLQPSISDYYYKLGKYRDYIFFKVRI